MKGQCELTGAGIEYISQVSVNSGKTWFPEQPATLTLQPKPDGRQGVMIPYLSNKKFLQIKLGDFPNSHGLVIGDYNFSNLVRSRIM